MSVNIENLRAIAQHMRKIAADAERTRGFHLATWISGEDSNSPRKAQSDRPECGTAACAIGFCALDGVIPGLTMASVAGDRVVMPKYERPGEETLYGWEAVEAVTGIDYEVEVETGFNVDDLFSACAYDFEDVNNPLRVAERIEGFLANVSP